MASRRTAVWLVGRRKVFAPLRSLEGACQFEKNSMRAGTDDSVDPAGVRNATERSSCNESANETESRLRRTSTLFGPFIV